jgi:hypothetical protein
MAKNWKLASPEEIEERNRKQRERYAKLDSEAKAKVIRRVMDRQVSLTVEQRELKKKTQRKPKVPKLSYIKMPDGTWKELTHPDWEKWIARKKKKMDAHKRTFMSKLDRIQAWQQAGGLFPWPNLIDKMEVTRLWIRIAHLLGRKCCQCQDWKMFDFSWRLTHKDDFLAFVPFKKEAYEQVLRNINDYELYCLRCAFDLRIFTFGWIFSPYSSRNNGLEPVYTGGPKYPNWTAKWPIMYPPGRALYDKIRAREIKSLTCGIIGPDGNFLETFIRKNQYYGWVGLQPRDFSWHTMDQARHFYSRLNPSVDVDFWGAGREDGRDLSEAKIGYDALGDETKRFLTEVKPVWEKLKEHPTKIQQPPSSI